MEEHALVQALADTQWRLELIPGLESALYAQARLRGEPLLTHHGRSRQFMPVWLFRVSTFAAQIRARSAYYGSSAASSWVFHSRAHSFTFLFADESLIATGPLRLAIR